MLVMDISSELFDGIKTKGRPGAINPGAASRFRLKLLGATYGGQDSGPAMAVAGLVPTSQHHPILDPPASRRPPTPTN
jgi:hypothetical protein